MHKRHWAAALAIVLMAVPTAMADDAAYEIKLHRPVGVGDVCTIHSLVDQNRSRKVEVKGQDPHTDQQAVKCELEGTLTVTAVDKNNNETSFDLAIKSLTVSVDNAEARKVVDGPVTASVTYKDKKTEMTAKEGTLSDQAKQALALIFSAPPTDQTDDQLFGTSGKKKIGDTWEVNAKEIAEQAAAAGMKLDPAKIKGTVKLSGKQDISGIPGLVLETNFEATDFAGEQGPKPKDSKVTVSATTVLPVETENPSGSSLVTTQVRATGEAKSGEDTATVTMAMDRKKEETRVFSTAKH